MSNLVYVTLAIGSISLTIAIIVHHKKLINSLHIFVRTKKKDYLKELSARVSSIPFIYPNDDANVLTDFVNVLYGEVELGFPGDYTKVTKSKGPLEDINITTHSFVKKKRVLFLANAGMGKTTLLSYITASIAEGKKSKFFEEFFSDTPNIVPVFIPLKLLSNADRYPVWDYIRSHYDFFSGKKGEDRLLKFASNGELLIVLDGYDEISVPRTENEARIKRDVEGLFEGIHFLDSGEYSTDGYMHRFYRSLKKNSIWLTSRRDYYLANRLEYEMNEYNRLNYPNITCIEIYGVAHKVDLVRRIFDRYRSISEEYKDKLSEDVFFQFVNRNSSEGMADVIGKSPLFLIVMCYVYINSLGSEEKSEQITTRNLILNCIELLINDIDEIKVRGLSEKIRAQLKEKRGLYREEKLDFLKYFAARTYTDLELSKMLVFSKEKLKSNAVDYFSLISNSKNNTEILDGILKERSNSLLNQLIDQNLLVYADNKGNLDFPHLRFREVLAVEFMDNEENYESLVKLIASKGFREFIILYYSNSQFFSQDLLSRMLYLSNDSDQKYLLQLAIDCIANSNDYKNHSSVIFGWLSNFSEFNVKVPRTLIQSINYSEKRMNFFRSKFTEGITVAPSKENGFYGAVLEAYSRSMYLEELMRLILEIAKSENEQLLIDFHILIENIESNSFVILINENYDNKKFIDSAFSILQAVAESSFLGDIWWDSITPHLVYEAKGRLMKFLLDNKENWCFVALSFKSNIEPEKLMMFLRKTKNNVLVYPDDEVLRSSIHLGVLRNIERLEKSIFFDVNLREWLTDLIKNDVNEISSSDFEKSYSIIKNNYIHDAYDWNKFVEYALMD